MARGQKIATAYLELGMNDRGLRSGIANTKTTVNRSFADLGRLAAGAMAAGFASIGIGSMIRDAIKEAKDMEVLIVQFETLTASAEKAAKLMEELKVFRDVSPFRLDTLAENAKLLLAYGLEAEKVVDVQRQLGDISGGSTEKLKRLSLAFGQVRAKGRLMGQEVIQLTESGFNPLQEISRTTGRSMKELMKEMENGNIHFDLVEKALKSATSEGGRFHGMIDEFQKTYAGVVARLAGRFQELQVVIGNELLPVMRVLAEIGLKLVNAFIDMDPALRKIVFWMATLTPLIWGAVTAFKALKVAGVSAGLAIRGALIASGWGIVIVAIGLIIQGVIALSKYFYVDLQGAINALEPAIKNIQRAWEVVWDALMVIFDAIRTALDHSFRGPLAGLMQFINEFYHHAADTFTLVAFIISEFVLNTAEWFNVIVTNWQLVMQLVGQVAALAWSRILDIVRNSLEASMIMVYGFANAVLEVFKSIPRALEALFSGRGIGDALDQLLTTAAIKFTESTVRAYAKLLDPSDATKALQGQVDASLKKLVQKKQELEAERFTVEDNLKDLDKKKEEEKKEEEKQAKKDQSKAGFVGLAEFNKEVQKLFLKDDQKDKDQKLIALGQNQLDAQKNVLNVNQDIRDALQNAPVVKVARN